MHFYHSNCPNLRGVEKAVGVPRLRIVDASDIISTRTLKCESCDTLIHVDLDYSADEEKNLTVRQILDLQYPQNISVQSVNLETTRSQLQKFASDLLSAATKHRVTLEEILIELVKLEKVE